jgi:hypothetical protein
MSDKREPATWKQTFDFPTCLAINIVCRRTKICSSGNEIECIVVILVEGNGIFTFAKPLGKSICAEILV